jgi:hypothetical protein
MAHSDHSKVSATFSSNYASTPTTVMKRKNVNIPNTQPPPGTGKLAPWNILFPFDSTWVYDGKQDLAWELHLYTVLSQTYFVDSTSTGVSGQNTSFGTGCVATGQTRNMLQQFGVTLKPWRNTVEYWTRLFYGPTVARAGIALGAKRTAVDVSWCTKVYTEPLMVWFGKTGTGNGIFNGVPYPGIKLQWQASFANVTFYTQGFAEDAKQPGGLALTQGLQTAVPPMPTDTRTASRIYTSQGNPTTASGFLGEGYGLDTRFQHK